MKNLCCTSANAWQAINTRVPDHVTFSSPLVQVFEIMKIKDEISFKLIILQTPICSCASLPSVSSFPLQITRIVILNQRAKESKTNGATSASEPRKRTPWNPHSRMREIFMRIHVNLKLPFYEIILRIKLLVSYFAHIDRLWFDQWFRKIRDFTLSDPFRPNTNPR